MDKNVKNKSTNKFNINKNEKNSSNKGKSQKVKESNLHKDRKLKNENNRTIEIKSKKKDKVIKNPRINSKSLKVTKTIKSEDYKIEKENNCNEKKVVNLKNKSSTKSKEKSILYKNISKPTKNKINIVENSDTDSEDNNWEEVNELTELINIENKNIDHKYQEIYQDYLRREVNRHMKEIYENIHKTHLLCLFAHGLYVNRVLTSQKLLATAMSIIPNNYFTPKRFNLSHLETFINWFSKLFTINSEDIDSINCFEETLMQYLSSKYINSKKDLVILFVLLSRSIGMNVRLVFSFYPISWKPPLNLLVKQNITSKSKVDMPSTSNEKIVKKNYKPNIKSSHNKLKKTQLIDDDFKNEKDNLKLAKEKSNRSAKRKNDVELKNIKRQKKEIINEWAEAYMEEEEKWISIDVTGIKFHCAKEIESRSASNLAYVVAYNPDQTVKDVTKRYVSNWLSNQNKLRCDSVWWEKTLKPFIGIRTNRIILEDEEMNKHLNMQPLPKTVGEYKNHPLYALQRHLLKFEAIYPPNISPIGYFKNEPVYPRECVKTLQGREYWIKEAKTVIVGEEPYKIVKGRPKWDKSTCQVIKDRPLELFGEWQIEDYVPPIAKNGKVPRNEYGNVELFKPSMLPKGCVHIPVNGLGKIARKLDIDCSPAIVGFEFHSGGSHPIYEGYVVCEEFKEILLDAWKQERIERIKLEEEKRIKQIYSNWKKLISGIILKERIKLKYGTYEKIKDTKTEKKPSSIHSRKEYSSKKVKKDLQTEPDTIVHPVVNLKIDFTSSAADIAQKMHKPKKRHFHKEKPKKVKFSKCEYIERSFSSSSDSEDCANAIEKQENIRTILNWQPNTGDRKSDTDLSDSDHDENVQKMQPSNRIQNLETVLLLKKKKPTKCIKHTLENNDNKCLESSDTDSLEFVDSSSQKCQKRLSLRKKINSISYQEDGDSLSDISLDRSDINDETYNPLKEDKHK